LNNTIGGNNMKLTMILSATGLATAAAAVTAAIFLFRKGTKKHPPRMTLKELYKDNAIKYGDDYPF